MSLQGKREMQRRLKALRLSFKPIGTVPHTIRAKRTGTLAFKAKQGHTVFARSVHHRGQRARPFRQRTADEALRRNPMAKTVIAQYNKAA
jgi:hypothetical protein